MLHLGEEDHITLAEKSPAPRLCHQIYAFSGSPREDNFISAGRSEIFRHLLPGFFISFRRTRTQFVKATMHVGVVVLIIMSQHLEHRFWFLRGCGVVEVNERMPMRPLVQDRKILAERAPIYIPAGNLVHILMCYRVTLRASYSESVFDLAQRSTNWSSRSSGTAPFVSTTS